MNKDQIDEIKARCEKATPGPWEWDVNSAHKFVNLMTIHSGRFYVMGFERWGAQGAAPKFQVYERYEGSLYERGSKGMFRADKLTKSYPGREHHEGWDDFIDHPDALFISNAKQDPIANILSFISIVNLLIKLFFYIYLFLIKWSRTPFLANIFKYLSISSFVSSERITRYISIPFILTLVIIGFIFNILSTFAIKSSA